MGNFRPRVKGKGRRWAKGQSSSSNPETRKYRDSAKSRFFHENLGQTGLTTEALQKHDAFSGVKTEEIQDDSFTVSDSTFKTFGTFASDWSSCSNQSFSRLLNGFRADSAIHKEMLAVLAAITDVLKSKGGKENEAEYFMALMTTLEVTDSADSVAAILSLLGMSIKKVPDAVLKAKFSEASKTLVNILAAYAESDNNIILRAVIGCLSVLLRAQEPMEWISPSMLQIYDSILAFTIHVKPKVRKAAQHAVCAILKGSCFMMSSRNVGEKDGGKSSEKIHPVAAHTAKFCIQEMERVSGLGSGSTSTLHMLGLLKEILPCFPKAQLKATCECILKVMTLGNVLVTSCGMQALHGLLVSRPSGSSFPPDLNARLIAALYQYQPPHNDTQPLLAWLIVMQEAYCNLALQDLSLCMGNVPRLFSTCTQLWLSDRQEVMSGATNVLYTVSKDCISLAISRILESQENQHKYLQHIQKAFGFVQSGLQYQYHHAWKHVFHLMSVMFEVCGRGPCQNFMLSCLKSLAGLRDSDKFAYSREVDVAIGKAISSFGPKMVLKAIPFTVTGQEKSYDFPRSWLLPVLKENIKNSEIQIFLQLFLPLASVCRNKSLELGAKNDQVGAHTYDLLQAQIWSLLPSFCNGATDVKENFKNIAKILGMAISERKDLRLDVMLSLRRLISKSLDSNEEDGKELGRFAKNYLPILFNLYTTQPNGSEEAGHRLAAFETIKLYLKVTDSELCRELFDRAFTKLTSFKPGLSGKKRKKKNKKGKVAQEAMEEDSSADDKKDVFVRESAMDLLRALLPFQSDGNRLRSLYDYCVPLLSSEDAHEQKKAYRVIEEICGSERNGASSSACKEFLNNNITDLQNVLLQSLSSAAPSCKGPRIRCLTHLVKLLDDDKVDVLKAIMPEAILCIKDMNEKCRAAAFNLLVEIGRTLQKWSSKPIDDVLRDYVAMVMAGLAGSPVLISSTILALGRVVYEFKGLFPKDLLQIVLENVCLLMVTTSREVVSSALSFAKVLAQSYGTSELAPFVPTLAKSLSAMVDDTKRHFRVPVRHLLERLVRRYGFEALSRVVPESDTVTHKRLNNIRKIQARKKRQKEEKDEDEESQEDDFKFKAKPMSIEEILAESDSDDEFFGGEKKQKVMTKKGKKQKASTWIQEGGDDSIVDFTDAAVAKKISATRPGVAPTISKAKKEKKEPFKTAPDGRLIITDGGDGEEADEMEVMGRKARRKRKAEDSGSDMDDEDDASVMAPITGKRKRGGSVTTEGFSVRPPIKYQAGGSGIHRPVNVPGKNKKQEQKQDFGSEYRSRKAKGDVKRKGKPDPFAYIPLSRKTLNKRKKAKSAGQFKSIVQAAKKGAQKGVKAKAKLNRR